LAELSPRLFSKLKDAVLKSRQSQESYRKHRRNRIVEYVGKTYFDDGARHTVPLNLLELLVTTYAANLVSSCPQVICSTSHRELAPTAYKFELALNHLIRHEIDLEGTLRAWVHDALFGMGILKVGVCAGYQVEIDGFTHDVGQPYCQQVSLDDWVHDQAASRWDKIQYCGNMYRVPLEKLDKELYDLTAVKASDHMPHNESGDSRTDTISRGTDTKAAEDQLYPEVALWDLWLPLDGLIVTVQADSSVTDSIIGEKPLRVVEWDGPECGPYHLLGYHDVPDQICPLPPTAVLEELHRIVNVLYRKLGRQAERQKKHSTFRGSSEPDAQRLNELNDGEWARMDDPTGVSEISVGGIDQSNYAFAIDAINRFSYMGGNIDSLAGLSPQAETAKQDQMLRESASVRMSEMQNRTMGATRKVIEAIGWHLFYDPFIEIPIVKRVEGTPLQLEGVFTPEDREGDYLAYNFEIEPYSMKYQGPAEKLNALNGMVQQIIIPLMPMMEQRGMTFDIEGYLRKAAKYSNINDLEELVIFAESNVMQDGPTGQPPSKMPANTSRTYNRVSSSAGGTRTSQDMTKVVAALGGNQQVDQQVNAFSQTAA
jgi:hypothetical protein